MQACPRPTSILASFYALQRLPYNAVSAAQTFSLATGLHPVHCCLDRSFRLLAPVASPTISFHLVQLLPVHHEVAQNRGKVMGRMEREEEDQDA